MTGFANYIFCLAESVSGEEILGTETAQLKADLDGIIGDMVASSEELIEWHKRHIAETKYNA